ncbi:helix-turn-helix domain-containing protein [Micromonospora zhanjiangensis]|uniref:Scr1 family TA system antitoxin-like transcriptional regulator n=1 Tax=Micromonospora zhanjiangensis TaxID=1522057 RepID=A0ABV8KEG0_9ACTN
MDEQKTAAAFLIAELRRARLRRGWSQEELAKAINYSASLVSAVEKFQQPPTLKYLELVDTALDTGGLFTRMLTELVTLDQAQPWLRGWNAIEEQSKTLRWYQSLYVPGILQTEDYARAVFEAGGLLDPDEVEKRLAARTRRHEILFRECPPILVAVLDERAIQRPVGGEKVMREQLLYLAKLAEQHRRIWIHAVPTSAGEYPGLGGPFIIATAHDGSELAFQDSQVRGQGLEQPVDLARLRRVWEISLGCALPVQESTDLIRKVAEQWA